MHPKKGPVYIFVSVAVFLAATLANPNFSAIHAQTIQETPVSPIGSSETSSSSSPEASNRVTEFFPLLGKRSWGQGSDGEWPMVAANPERTSWTAEEVQGTLKVEWYRPIEAYISQNTQIIAANGLLYISTARGLYALNAENGEVAWRFDTELPVGNSPTVAKGVVYVGGFDRKLHALDALTGNHLWAFEGAAAGFSTNPLVIGGRVIVGNRDGAIYAIGAHGTPQQSQLLWKYQTGGPILVSPAYRNGTIFFPSNDNYGYAIKADTGKLVWKSQKLPGDGYLSYWAVVYGDKVIFSGASGYRHDLIPGTRSVSNEEGSDYGSFNRMQRDDLFFDKPGGGTVGPVTTSAKQLAAGNSVINLSRVSEYLENNPKSDPHLHKPWRRTTIVLNTSNGSEYTTDVDRDGYPEFVPIVRVGSNSGNSYPPIVGPDQVLYATNVYKFDVSKSVYQATIMGWREGTAYFSLMGGDTAVDEPQSISAGGSRVYRNLCCDRSGIYFDLTLDDNGSLWSYDLSSKAPGYDVMWWGIDQNSDLPRLLGNYGSQNGVYHNHGDQNPLIPYQGRLYVHRSNAIIAFGPKAGPGGLPILKIQASQDAVKTPSLDELKGRLDAEVAKMISAGRLRPGYYNAGQFSQLKQLNNYFENPGDTLYTLARAYPYLSSQRQDQVRNYLQAEFSTYFDPKMYSRIGWGSGAAREAAPIPPEVQASMAGSEPSNYGGDFYSWDYPQNNFYAMWKYAQIFPDKASRVYDLAKSRFEFTGTTGASDAYLQEKTWEFNAYIAGYIGFLNLQELAGKSASDSGLRSQVSAELDRLLQLRAATFSKDTPWVKEDYHMRTLNIARNFMMLVPELGDYLNQTILPKVQEAINEYNFTAPYWFVSRYNGVVNEGAVQHLYDYGALFQAKAYILKEPREQLTKYLDVPAFERGDLFYIQNLVAAIEAGPH